MPAKSAGSKRAIFCQACELIPPHLVPKLAREREVKSWAITPWSHLVSMLYGQFAHAIGRNDVADALQANRAGMAAIRGAAFFDMAQIEYAHLFDLTERGVSGVCRPYSSRVWR